MNKPTLACMQVTILWNQIPMAPHQADWGRSKVVPSTKARASSTLWNYLTFNCRREREKSHKGLNIENIGNGLKSERYFAPEDPYLQIHCSRWHCHGWAIDYRYLFGNAVHNRPGTFCSRICWQTSPSWLSFCLQALLCQHDRILRRSILAIVW